MELTKLGFDNWFRKKAHQSTFLKYKLARISAVEKDSYYVIGEKGKVFANIVGKLRYKAESNLDLPITGDWVFIEYFNDDTLAVIYNILPRKSLLKRKTAGKKMKYQLLSANIDTAFIVQSLDTDYNIRRLERYLVAVIEGNIEPVILLSKSDMVSEEEINEKLVAISNYRKKYKTIAFSNKTGVGLDSVKNSIKPGKTYCLIGSSGVGKTTLINRLIGKDIYATGEVRLWDGKGKHITTRRQLIILKNGGLIIDTPGLREFGNIDINTGISDIFTDIENLTSKCRYRDCSHTNELGCAVLDAINEGELSIDRFRNYEKLRRESEYNRMTYVEKRRKDKTFGKFVKKSLKHHWKKIKY